MAYRVDEDGKGIAVRIFINTPYDNLVGLNTRFWHASGIDMQIGPAGASLKTESLASIVLGGLSFQSPPEGPGPAAEENTAFTLARNQAEALGGNEAEPRTILVNFKQSVRGLAPGAEISFRGLCWGKSNRLESDMIASSRNSSCRCWEKFILRVWAEQRLKEGKQLTYTPQQLLQLMVDRGLVAQLRTANFLTGQAYVALDFFPKALPSRPAKKEAVPGMDVGEPGSVHLLPTIPGGSDEIQGQISEIARKLSKVPFDQIGDDLRQSLRMLQHTLDSAGQLATKLNTEVAPK